MKKQSGFSLVELMVVTVIFVFLMLGLYTLLDQGQWLFLGGEKRINAQDNARVILAALEQELRMIGFGVPLGNDVGGATTYTQKWSPIAAASINSITYVADVDKGNSILSANASGSQIPLHDATYYAGVASSPKAILLISNRRQWADLTANGISGTTLTTSAAIPSVGTFTADKSEVVTMERVAFRLVRTGTTTLGDSNNDGICDVVYPFCSIEKKEFTTNNPTVPDDVTVAWQTYATQVREFRLTYLDAAGATLNPSVAANLPAITRIIIEVSCRERDKGIGLEQDATLRSEIAIRNRIL